MNEQERSALLEKFERATELPLLLLAVAMVPLLGLPLLLDLDRTTERAMEMADWVIWAVFALELSVRTYLANQRIKYLTRNWFDVMIVALPFLRPLRVVRSARALRLLRVARIAPFMARVAGDAKLMLRRRGLQYVLALWTLCIFASAGLVVLVEKPHGGTIDDYGTALWWAATTMTTVGYGDAVPETPAGRGIAVFLMLVGISFFSWITANVAAFLVELGDGGSGPASLSDVMKELNSIKEEVRLLRDRDSINAPGRKEASTGESSQTTGDNVSP